MVRPYKEFVVVRIQNMKSLTLVTSATRDSSDTIVGRVSRFHTHSESQEFHYVK